MVVADSGHRFAIELAAKTHALVSDTSLAAESAAQVAVRTYTSIGNRPKHSNLFWLLQCVGFKTRGKL